MQKRNLKVIAVLLLAAGMLAIFPGRASASAKSLVHFFDRTRWNRTLQMVR